MSNKLNSAEAIFGFITFLTMQQSEIKLGGGNKDSSIPGLVQKFCEENNLELPEENWIKKVTFPA